MSTMVIFNISNTDRRESVRLAFVAQGDPNRVSMTRTVTRAYPRRSRSESTIVGLEEVDKARRSAWDGPSDEQLGAFIKAVRSGAVYDPFEGVNLGGLS